MKNVLSIFITIILALWPSSSVSSQETEKGAAISISVDDVRVIAINNNLDVKLAQLESRIKGTELSLKEAAFDTILNGEIDYTQDETKPASTISGSKNITNNYNIGIDKKFKTGADVEIDFTNKRDWTNSSFVSLNPYHDSQIEISLTQPLAKNLFGLLDRGAIEIVKREIRNAELDSYIKIEDAIISSEKAYWELVLSAEEFKIKKGILKKAVQLFNQYRRKLKIGLVESGDVLAAEANMHIRESELLLAANKLKSAEEALRLKLNMKNEVRLSSLDALGETRFDASLLNCLDVAFENRRDYLSKKNEIESKDIDLKMKSNSRLPEIDLKTTFAANGLDSKYYRALEGVIEDSNPKYYVGIEFKFPLENNEANSLFEKADLEKAKSIIELEKTERKIISDIDKRFRDVAVNKINIANMLRVENLQKGKLIQEEKRFRYGRSSSDMLIRYQEDFLNARLMTQKAYLDYKNSVLDLLGDEDYFLKYIGLE